MNFATEWKQNTEYFHLLALMARLSNLFSDNSIPFLHYRVTENLFCKYYRAENLSRSDTAFDAKTQSFGIGIKTFQLKNGASTEKIAEFNSISTQLAKFKDKDLACQIAHARNERIELGKRLYAITDECYHIIGREQGGLIVFNSPYPLINIEKIHSVKDTMASLQFEDDIGIYSYNYSKSTLFKKFVVPSDAVSLPVSIIQDPYELLKSIIDTVNYTGKSSDIVALHQVIQTQVKQKPSLEFGRNYILLPLFSVRDNAVPQKSGLNQWNAAGRKRDSDEVYISIPAKVKKMYPDFFPGRDVHFNLHLPDGGILTAKVCQDGDKALMSYPNKSLGKWILRDILQLKEGQLVTLDLLNKLGFDSVIIYKDSPSDYRIDVSTHQRYSSELFYDED